MAKSVPFYTNVQCESALVWRELTDRLEEGMKDFSLGKVEQPVREMLGVEKYSAFFGNFKNNLIG